MWKCYMVGESRGGGPRSSLHTRLQHCCYLQGLEIPGILLIVYFDAVDENFCASTTALCICLTVNVCMQRTT